MVELLLSRGATLCSRDALGFHVLHRAVWVGDVPVISALLFISPESRVAQQWGPRNPDEPELFGVLEAVRPSSAQVRPTTGDDERARTSKRKQSLSWRVGAMRLVNAVHPSTGRTPLMLATIRGSATIVDFLLNVCDADMYCEDAEGFTAVDLAALCGHLSILRIFLAKADRVGTGSEFPRLQQRVEEFGETAHTIPRRNMLNEVNRLMALDFSSQSRVAAR